MAQGAERPGRRWTAFVDLALVVVLAGAVVVATYGPVPASSPARLAAAVVGVVLPGYALVAALFPRGPSDPGEPRQFAERVRRPDGFDRLALSVATAFVATPLLGIAVHFSPLAVRRDPVVGALVGFVALATLVAGVRRWRLPAADRYAPARRWGRVLAGPVRGGGPGLGTSAVTVAVAVAVVVAAGGVLAVATTAQTGEEFTEFAVLTETDAGELVAAGYPGNVTVGTETQFRLEIENREGERAAYTVVTKLNRLEENDDATRVTESETFDPVRVTVGSGRTKRVRHAVTPTMTGERLRLVFLLYRGAPPAEAVPTNAYRRTHVWLNVTATAEDTVAQSRVRR